MVVWRWLFGGGCLEVVVLFEVVVPYIQHGRIPTVDVGEWMVCSEVDRTGTAACRRCATRWTGKEQRSGGGGQRGGEGLCERRCDSSSIKEIRKEVVV